MNIKKYYLYQFFKELMPIYPVYMILFESKEFDIFQISMLLTIWSVPVVILEIPSGIIADRWSRKNLLVSGSILKTLCFVFWLFADEFLFYAIGFVLWGVSIALCSGAEESLIYDSLKSIGKEDTFDKILGRGNFLSGLSIAFASVSGGFISVRSGMDTALIITVISGIITTCFALSFHEINLNKSIKSDSKFKISGMLKDKFLFFIKKHRITIIDMIMILIVGTKRIEEEGRSTVHSIISLINNLFGTLFCVILGVVFSISNLFGGMILIAVYMGVLIVLLCLINCVKEIKSTAN